MACCTRACPAPWTAPAHRPARACAQAAWYDSPAHPYTIAANVVWAALLGWQFMVFHLALALVQALSVVGIGTALTNLQLAAYVM